LVRGLFANEHGRVNLPPARRRALQELGLRALVKRRFGPQVADGARSIRFAGGAAIAATAEDGVPIGAVFANSPAGLGAAIDLADREGAQHVYFFCELNSPAIARRAAEFALDVSVIDPDGDFQTLEPEVPTPEQPVPDQLWPAAARLSGAGLDVEWEHGILTGEWLGLEVARAALDSSSRDGFTIDVGVGKHDREATTVMFPNGVPDSFLDQTVATVRELRRPDAIPHPANQLAPERWLRAILRRQPGLVGLADVRSGPSPEPRFDLRDRSIAPAWSAEGDGPPVVLACSAGVDPDLVPQAADARRQAPGWVGFVPDGGAPRLRVVVPEGDDHPMVRRLAALLRRPAEVVTVPTDWRHLGG
jgi:hypothetical protein